MKKFKVAVACVLCALVLAFTPMVAYHKTTAENNFPVQTPQNKLVLTLWNIDTFEGGVGSRTDFLAERFLDCGKKGVYLLTKSHTVESAEIALNKGELPDIISFGVGFGMASEYALELPQISFKGGEIGGKTYAYPWCVGGYFLIRKNGDNQLIERLFVSQNEYNLPNYAAIENGVECKEKVFKKPLDAYTSFLGGKNGVALLGTQRDLKRLAVRGVEFVAQPLVGFSDLVQYACITTKDEERYGESLKFIEYLISETAQEKLAKIGMQSPFKNIYQGGETFGFEFSSISFTVSPFTSTKALCALNDEINTPNPTNDSLLRLKNALKRL